MHRQMFRRARFMLLPFALVTTLFLCPVRADNGVPNVQWLQPFAKQMGSITFTRKEAETNLKPYDKQFEALKFEETHPRLSGTGCEHFLNVEMRLVPSARPALSDLEKLFGPAKKLPLFPDDFSGRETYGFYPSTAKDQIFVRVFAEIRNDGSHRVAKLSVDREKLCQ